MGQSIYFERINECLCVGVCVCFTLWQSLSNKVPVPNPYFSPSPNLPLHLLDTSPPEGLACPDNVLNADNFSLSQA